MGVRRTSGDIMKIQYRDRQGKLIRKRKLSFDDIPMVKQELRVLRDKFGVPRLFFAEIAKESYDKEEYNNVKALIKKDIAESEAKIKASLNN